MKMLQYCLLFIFISMTFGEEEEGEQTFSINGDVSLTKGDHVWSTPDWSDEFNVEFDVIVNKELPGSWKSLFHLTTGENLGVGGRIPAIFLNPAKYFYTCYHVNGDDDYCQNYNYELNKDYHFEISQHKNSKGEAVYSITVNGETVHEIVNKTPLKYKDVKLYLSDPWYETFAPFGKLSNLKIIANLTLLITKCKEISEAFPTYIPYINCEGCQCGTNAVCKNKVCQCQSGFTGDPFVSCNDNTNLKIGVTNCPINEPNTFKIDGGCYMFVDQQKTFNDAKTFCESKRGRLFEPRSVRTNKLVADKGFEVFQTPYQDYMWFGIISKSGKSGPWKFATSGENVVQTIWYSGQPNNIESEVCAYYNTNDGGKWNDADCTYNYRLICEFV